MPHLMANGSDYVGGFQAPHFVKIPSAILIFNLG